MNLYRHRWARRPLTSAATALFAASLASSAFATQKHTLQPGETLCSIARHYHISVHDLVAANHLPNPDSVPDYSHLTIPSAPKKLTMEPQMHRKGLLAADRVNVRRGPDESYRPLDCFNVGTPVVVTAERGEWAQISLPGERTGWVKLEFVRLGGKKPLQVASNSPHREPGHKPHHQATLALAEDENKKARKRLAHSVATRLSRKHRQHQEPVKIETASHGHKRHAVEVAQAHHHKHAVALLATAHRRHLHALEVAQRERHHHHAIQLASHHRHHGHHAMAEASAPAPSSDLVRTAYAYRGTPYRWGGASRGGFDCSGFTSYLYRQRGLSLPHSARAQFGMGHHVDKGGMKAGDLVFFHTVTPGISHVGMYVGNGRFVHASSRRSGGVRVDNIDSGYYSKAFRGARRFSK